MRIDKDLVAASATPLVLGILADGDLYGYAILKRVGELSGGRMQWTDGMLYPLLHRLERLGHVVVLGHVRGGSTSQALRDHLDRPGDARRTAGAVGRRRGRAAAGLGVGAAARGRRGGVGVMAHDDELEAQIDRWRGYVHRRQVISSADVDELEDHLRGQVADLRGTGLDDDEAFLVAIKRLGNLDAVSREYAREHSDRLWKQLALVPDDSTGSPAPRWRELAVVIALAAGAGVAVRVGIALFDDETALVRNIGLLVVPFLAAYLGWKRQVGVRTVAAIVVPFVVLAVALNVYPFVPEGSTEMLAALHAPVVLWLLVGLAYVAESWRSDGRRMDFVRFTGELAIYYTLLALGGGVLLGLTAGVLQLVGVDPEPVITQWVMPFAVPGALIVAAWLVEAKQDVVENIAPVLTRIFTPLTIVMLVAVLVALIASGGLVEVNRDLLILMDAILVLVLALLLVLDLGSRPAHPARARRLAPAGPGGGSARGRRRDADRDAHADRGVRHEPQQDRRTRSQPAAARAPRGLSVAQRPVPARSRHVRGARALADAVPAGLRRLGRGRRDRVPAAVRLRLTRAAPTPRSATPSRRRTRSRGSRPCAHSLRLVAARLSSLYGVFPGWRAASGSTVERLTAQVAVPLPTAAGPAAR